MYFCLNMYRIICVVHCIEGILSNNTVECMFGLIQIIGSHKDECGWEVFWINFYRKSTLKMPAEILEVVAIYDNNFALSLYFVLVILWHHW